MPTFFAAPDGKAANGYLVANGQVYPAVSGYPNSLYRAPEGVHPYGEPQALKKSQYKSMSDGSGNKGGFRKFHIGTGPESSDPIPDPYAGFDRVGVEAHYDGKAPGTEGCIGYQDPAAKDALIADPNKKMTIDYSSKDLDQVKAKVEAQLGHKVDWSKVETLRPAGSGIPDPRSITKKGKKVEKGNPKTLLGTKKRQTAHRDAPLEGGGKITLASRTVFVGEQRQGVARVADATTHGPVATGESSILVG